MTTLAPVMRNLGGPTEVEYIELDPPRAGEGPLRKVTTGVLTTPMRAPAHPPRQPSAWRPLTGTVYGGIDAGRNIRYSVVHEAEEGT